MSETKAIILTGASRGIGLAIAKYLLAQKHSVFLVARTKGPMEALKNQFPDQVEFLSADLADFEVCHFSFSSFCVLIFVSGFTIFHFKTEMVMTWRLWSDLERSSLKESVLNLLL